MKRIILTPILMFIITSCAGLSHKREVASTSLDKKQLEKSIYHDLVMAESHVITSKNNGFRKYLAQLNERDLVELEEEVKQLKSRSKDIHNKVTDWLSTLSRAELIEIRKESGR